MKTINEIYLEKKSKVIVDKRTSDADNALLVATIHKNIESLGYVFSKKLFQALAKLDRQQIEKFYLEVVPVLKRMRGAHRKFSPMYPNFPKQVLEMSHFELYFNAICHYWSVGTWLPEYEIEERFPLTDITKYDVIDIGNEKNFQLIFKELVGSKTSISQSDKDIVTWFVEYYKDKVVNFLPEEIHMKEQLSFLISLLIEHTKSAEKLSAYVKTPTDVLRIITAMSDGDVSLKENVKFVKLNRKFRRLFLSYIENCSSLEENMLKYKTRWIRLGEILHPGEYSKQYPRAFKAFQALRNSKKISTFNSKVESALLQNNISDTVKLLKTRPGEFARRLDQVLRNAPKKKISSVTKEFANVAKDVATPVLLQVSNHFRNRNKQKVRVAFPKGSVAKAKVLNIQEKGIDEKICQGVTEQINSELVSRFKKLPKLGNVFIDEDLKRYNVPFSQRSASKALKTIVRGSQVSLEEVGDTIRFFIWWEDISIGHRVDIDLSAVLLDENWNHDCDIAYYNLKEFGGHHSGDITSAPKGACEFIDISMKKVLARGARYVVMCVNSFTGQSFDTMPECFAGWMIREQADSGEIFEAKTVKNKIDISANTRFTIPLIIDVLERKVIWTDIALANRPEFPNNVHSNKTNICLTCKAIANLQKTTLYDLFSLHAKARGRVVKDAKKADVIFSVNQGTPFETDKIVSEFL